jgi:hypothetical protein
MVIGNLIARAYTYPVLTRRSAKAEELADTPPSAVERCLRKGRRFAADVAERPF